MTSLNKNGKELSSSSEYIFSDWVKKIRESEIRRLLRFTPKYYFAGGKPGVIPVSIFHNIIRELLEKERKLSEQNNIKYLDAYNYGQTEGSNNLRVILAKRLENRDGLKNVTDNDIVITSGSQQAIYAVCDTLFRPGDLILAARPTYLGFLQPAEKLECKIVTIPSDENGIIPEYIPMAFKTCQKELGKRPRMLYCVPYSDNPKGTTLPETRKKAILDSAFDLDFLILEDMAYKEIQFNDTKLSPMKQYDTENERVLYLSSTTKEAASFRIGYSLYPDFMKDEIIKAKGIYDLCSSEFVQAILSKYYSRYIDQALKEVRHAYSLRRNAMLKTLEEWDLGTYTKPTGGFFVWFECTDKQFNSTKFIETAINNDISYVPGGSFYSMYGYDILENGQMKNSSPKFNTMRLGFSLLPPSMIEEGIHNLGLLIKKYLIN